MLAKAKLIRSNVIRSLKLSLFFAGRGYDRRIEHGCEGETVRISCEEGFTIRPVRANFGRFSVDICGHDRRDSWSVSCIQPKTLRIVKERCDGKHSCHLPVTVEVFGEPCAGTSKYLEVLYTCERTTEEKAVEVRETLVAPWLRDLSATPPTTTTRPTLERSTTTTEMNIAYNDGLEVDVNVVTYDLDNEIDDILEDYEDEETEDDYGQDSCPPIVERNLRWNRTVAGAEVAQECPPGSAGVARWGCGPDGHWSSQYPNLGGCRSHWLARLAEDASKATAGDLASRLEEFASLSTIYGGDLRVAVHLLKTLPDRLGQELREGFPSQRVAEREASVLRGRVSRIASDLLEPSRVLAWQDLLPADRASIASSLLAAVSSANILLAGRLNREWESTVNATNVMADVRVRGLRHAEEERLVDEAGDYLLAVPREALAGSSVNGAVRLVLTAMQNLEHVLPGTPNDRFMNSIAVGACVPEDNTTPLPAPIYFTVRHRVVVGADDPICASWSRSAHSWQTDVCRVVRTSATHTTCECDQFGHFAVLARPAGGIIVEGHSASAPGGWSAEENESLALAGACLLIALVVFGLTIGLVYAKRRSVCGGQSTSSETYYPPLATASPLSSAASCRGSTIYKKENTISGHSVYRSSLIPQPQAPSQQRTVVVPSSLAEQLYNHIYSEIDPSYAAYVASHRRAHSGLGCETSSEMLGATSSEGTASSRGSPTFFQPAAAVVGTASRAISGSSAAVPPPPQPPVPVAITLRDGEQFVRLRLEDPYNAESHRQQGVQQGHFVDTQPCFQV